VSQHKITNSKKRIKTLVKSEALKIAEYFEKISRRVDWLVVNREIPPRVSINRQPYLPPS
jgi:hypothetical protein